MAEFAAGIIIRDKKILLLKRASNEGAEPGKWNPSNETIEDGENPEEAVVRGVKEETNLDFSITKLLFEHFYDDKKTNVYLGNASGDLAVDEKESSDSGWFSYEDAVKLDYAFGYGEVIEKLHELGLI